MESFRVFQLFSKVILIRISFPLAIDFLAASIKGSTTNINIVNTCQNTKPTKSFGMKISLKLQYVTFSSKLRTLRCVAWYWRNFRLTFFTLIKVTWNFRFETEKAIERQNLQIEALIEKSPKICFYVENTISFVHFLLFFAWDEPCIDRFHVNHLLCCLLLVSNPLFFNSVPLSPSLSLSLSPFLAPDLWFLC